MTGRTETRIHDVSGFLLVLFTAIAVFALDAPAVLAFIVPVFGGLVTLMVFESLRDGWMARWVSALRARRGPA